MESTSDDNIARKLIDSCLHFILDEFLPRIHKCFEFLSEEEIWIKPNINTTSVGNLILHLAGNVRQWLVTSFGKEHDTRDRASEFEEENHLTKVELLDYLSSILNQSKNILKQLNHYDLLRDYQVQAYKKSGIAILIHVVEHFSYHVGQITYFVKSRKDVDTGYYSGIDLNQTN